MDEIIGQGYNGSITLTDTGVNIKPGVMGAMFKGGSIFSEKFIPFNSISGVELKKGFPIIGEGRIQINTRGEISSSKESENMGEAVNQIVIRFGALLNKTFEDIANRIMERLSAS